MDRIGEMSGQNICNGFTLKKTDKYICPELISKIIPKLHPNWEILDRIGRWQWNNAANFTIPGNIQNG